MKTAEMLTSTARWHMPLQNGQGPAAVRRMIAGHQTLKVAPHHEGPLEWDLLTAHIVAFRIVDHP
jgi:hypothetical protein